MTEPYYTDDAVTLYAGDCLDVLPTLPDNSVDAVCTDPPYGLGFMGHEWDQPGHVIPKIREGIPSGQRRRVNPKPSGFDLEGSGAKEAGRYDLSRTANQGFQQWCQLWAAECLRVLKPGGHGVFFGGTRTFHRLACALEDAGFEIRDSIAWIHGSGFSKSWNFRTMYQGKWCECGGENPIPYNHAGNADLPRVREDIQPPSVARGESEDPLLLAAVQRGSSGSGVGDAWAQGPSGLVTGGGSLRSGEDDRRAKPGVAGRLVHRAGQGLPDDPQTGPSASTGEPLRSRAPSRDGGDDRAASDAPRGSAPSQRGQAGQPAGEPEAVPGPHESLDGGALRHGAICPRCGGLDQVYKGFGSGIKPAHEPVTVARKPLAGSIASNTEQFGTGALNIDGCRIGTQEDLARPTVGGMMRLDGFSTLDELRTAAEIGAKTPKGRDARLTLARTLAYMDSPEGKGLVGSAAGRWPANVALDETAAAALDHMSAGQRAAKPSKSGSASGDKFGGPLYGTGLPGQGDIDGYADSGGASRFMYTAKAGSGERITHNGVAHATVKPLALMRWLVRLVTPPGGLILEPFAGSGTTIEAALIEGFRCIAIEREADYLPLITQRLNRRRDPIAYLTTAGEDLGLFGDSA